MLHEPELDCKTNHASPASHETGGDNAMHVPQSGGDLCTLSGCRGRSPIPYVGFSVLRGFLAYGEWTDSKSVLPSIVGIGSTSRNLSGIWRWGKLELVFCQVDRLDEGIFRTRPVDSRIGGILDSVTEAQEFVSRRFDALPSIRSKHAQLTNERSSSNILANIQSRS